jgi:membrane-associated phospholipid phosphatase
MNMPSISHFSKSLLLIVLCAAFLQPSARAQHVSLDMQAVTEMMEHRHDDPVKFYQKISNTTNYISMLAPISVLATGIARNDRITIQKGLYLAESLAASSLVTLGLKYTFKRQRPFVTDPLIVSAGSGGNPSFPSGHSSEAFATATSLYLAFPKWYVAVPAYAWAASVGYSRIYLGVHYPSDVLAGAVIGAGSAWLMYKANKWLFKKKPSLKPEM